MRHMGEPRTSRWLCMVCYGRGMKDGARCAYCAGMGDVERCY